MTDEIVTQFGEASTVVATVRYMRSPEYTLKRNAFVLFAEMTNSPKVFNDQLDQTEIGDVYDSLTNKDNAALQDLSLKALLNIVKEMDQRFSIDLVNRGLIESFLRPLLQRSPGEVSNETMLNVTSIFA